MIVVRIYFKDIKHPYIEMVGIQKIDFEENRLHLKLLGTKHRHFNWNEIIYIEVEEVSDD